MNKILYIVKQFDSDYIKIGISNNNINRFKQLNRDYIIDWERSLYFEGIEEDIVKMEKIIHRLFYRHQTIMEGTGGTEWFTFDEVERIIDAILFNVENSKYEINLEPKIEYCEEMIYLIKEMFYKMQSKDAKSAIEYAIKNGRLAEDEKITKFDYEMIMRERFIKEFDFISLNKMLQEKFDNGVFLYYGNLESFNDVVVTSNPKEIYYFLKNPERLSEIL